MPTAVDLFSGAGGLSEGFTRAGFRILLAIDQDPESMKTYRLNHQQVPDDRMIVGDIRDIKAGSLRKLVGRKRIDVLARRNNLTRRRYDQLELEEKSMTAPTSWQRRAGADSETRMPRISSPSWSSTTVAPPPTSARSE